MAVKVKDQAQTIKEEAQVKQPQVDQDHIAVSSDTPPHTAAVSLNQAAVPPQPLLLRANIPSTVTLTGPADMLFGAFTVTVKAVTLNRNLAETRWGTTTATVTGGKDYLFAAPARVTYVGFDATSGNDCEVRFRQNGEFGAASAVTFTLSGSKKIGGKTVAFDTDAVRLVRPLVGTFTLRSPSLPSRVGVAIGDDTPLQVFPSAMEAGGTVVTRDLAASLNAAWQKAKPSGGAVSVPLRLTSLTDGAVEIRLAGVWGRSYSAPEVAVSLDPVNPTALAVNWPFADSASPANVSLALDGRLTGGGRLKLTSPGAGFSVRVQEQVEVAQAVLLAAGDRVGEARSVTAIWLLLPALPAAEQTVELRLAAAEGDPIGPSAEPLAHAEVVLPADAAAYVAQGGQFWYRAALEKPVELDGAQMGETLFLVAVGRGEGTLLCHRSYPGPAIAAPDRAPAGPMQVGAALVRNSAGHGAWEPVLYSRRAATWVMDLELAPRPAEYPSLVQARVGAATQAVPFAGASQQKVAVTWSNVAKPSSGPLAVTLETAVSGAVKARVGFYMPVKV